ncbi:MAG TPA: hypothetical protein VG847_13735 [Chitinophagaceae bacterium]|nr:hypothetical protein [Chitinophagaceae bacterium]
MKKTIHNSTDSFSNRWIRYGDKSKTLCTRISYSEPDPELLPVRLVKNKRRAHRLIKQLFAKLERNSYRQKGYACFRDSFLYKEYDTQLRENRNLTWHERLFSPEYFYDRR